jgi:ribosomal protein S14
MNTPRSLAKTAPTVNFDEACNSGRALNDNESAVAHQPEMCGVDIPGDGMEELTKDKSAPKSERLRIMNARGGCYRPEALARKMDINRDELRKLREKNEIIAFPVKEEEIGYVFPCWQFDRGVKPIEPWKGLKDVLALLGHDPIDQAAFLLDSHISTYLKTPLDGLIEGKLELVLEAAGGLYEQGTA